ncbi:MAG: hypothetical protein O0W93_04965 [Methanocorpusculum sp.]|nr:hypothetical protein [Methanocorpusculum sp.]
MIGVRDFLEGSAATGAKIASIIPFCLDLLPSIDVPWVLPRFSGAAGKTEAGGLVAMFVGVMGMDIAED